MNDIEIHLTRRIKLWQQTKYGNSWAHQSGMRNVMIKNNDLKFIHWFKLTGGLQHARYFRNTLID
jgi:hypothetical protein